MTTDCMTDYASADRRVHDTVIGVVVAVIFIVPAALAALTLL